MHELEIKLDEEKCKQIGRFLREKTKDHKYYKFDNPMENPELNPDIEILSNFYGSVININHHFWHLENGKLILEFGLIYGEKFKGATFLWRKSKIMLDKDPNFFSAKSLSNLSEDIYCEWLSDDRGKIPIYDTDKHRLRVTRDFGIKLLNYKGSFNEVYEQSDHKLLSNGNGFLERCEIFEGYGDRPFYKKANLVAKILERRGIWKFKDPENKIPPIDYHLQNMAYKLGMIDIPNNLKRKIKGNVFLNYQEEYNLRQACVKAYKTIAIESCTDPYYLDDHFWGESRKYCQEVPLNCDGMNEKRACLFREVCTAYSSDKELKQLTIPLVDTYRY
jgi:hypothetical protein